MIDVTPESGIPETLDKLLPGRAWSGSGRPQRAGWVSHWTREEIILAMDFYVTCGAINGGPIPGQHSDQIVRVSTLLSSTVAVLRSVMPLLR